MNLLRGSTTAALVLLLFQSHAAWGQQTPPAAKPNPQAPVLDLTGPAGMRRGTTQEITLTGKNLAGPTGVYLGFNFPGKVTIPQEGNNGREENRLRVRVECPPYAALDFYALRLATRRGISNVRLFCIDDLPQVMKTEDNTTHARAQAVAVPCVVVGRVQPEASAYYKVHVKAGQRLTFEVLGRRLGSTLDPQLTLSDAAGRELAYDNDSPGCQTDPRLIYTFTQAGDYVVEVRDVLYRGGADFWYRLRIGDFPCATTPLPMAAQRGSSLTIRFAGPLVAGVHAVPLDVPSDPLVNVVNIAPRFANFHWGWPVELALSDFPEGMERRPNHQPSLADERGVPSGVTGLFEKRNELHYFRYSARKSEKLLVEAHTLEHHSPSLVYLAIKDVSGKTELARSNPQLAPPADQKIEFSPPADGDYLVEVQHLNYQGGPSESFRLTVTPVTPSFELTLPIERYDAFAGSSVSVPILVTRQGFTGPIDVAVVSRDPRISGKVTIPAGKPAKANEPGAVLQVQVQPDVSPGPYTFTLRGTAMVNGKAVSRLVDVQGAVSQSLENLPYPPRFLFHELALAVKPAPPPATKKK